MSTSTPTSYDQTYAQAVPCYARATPGSTEREQAADLIVQAARILILTGVNDLARPAGLDPDQIQDIVSECLMSVLAMAESFDTSRGVTFAQWLKARSSPWRSQAADLVSRARHPHLTDVERRALTVAQSVISDYMTQHGHRPDPPTLQHLLAESSQNWATERSEGDDEARVRALERNSRSGYNRAVRDIEEILSSVRTAVHPDADMPGLSWDTLVAPEEPEVLTGSAEMEAAARMSALAGVSQRELFSVFETQGSLKGRARSQARTRMVCPHAQYAYLAPGIPRQFT